MQDLNSSSYNEWLVIRCKQGERQALELLIAAWEKRYYLYAYNRLKNSEAAKDVVQDSFISISRNIVKLRDASAYPKWGFRILERRCIDWLRKTIRERETIEFPGELPEIAIDDEDAEKLDIEQLLDKFDSKTATLVRLFYLEGFDLKEIGEILSIPAGTVKSRLFYARKLMASTLEK